MDRKSVCFEALHKRGSYMYLTFLMKMESSSSSMISMLIYYSPLYLDLKVSFVFVINVNEWDKTMPILPRSITTLPH